MRRASLAVLVPIAFLLSGCVFPPMPGMPGFPGFPDDDPIPGETLIPDDPDACADGSLVINEPGE
jgi:hypothetical protein